MTFNEPDDPKGSDEKGQNTAGVTVDRTVDESERDYAKAKRVKTEL